MEKRHYVLAGQWVVSSEQDVTILVNHSAEFGSSCLLS